MLHPPGTGQSKSHCLLWSLQSVLEDFYELVIVLKGTAEHIVKNESYPVSGGDVFVINSRTEHAFSEAENMKICNIMFKPEIMLENIYNIRQTAGFQALFVLEPHFTQNHGFSSGLKLDSAGFNAVKSLIEDIIQEYTNWDIGWQTVVYSDFIRLCSVLSRMYETSNSNKNVFRLSQAIAYIEKNFCEEISNAELAKLSGYSERQFNRLFRSAFGSAPKHYINDLRIRKAQQLLHDTDMSMSEIAWNCGFNDQNYFSRSFKAHTVFSPTEYRALF